MLTRTTLDSRWSLRAPAGPVPDDLRGALDEGVPAVVPGDVHMALADARLIEDPADGDREHALTWIGETDWQYRRTLERVATDHERVDLVLQGVDTVAVLRVDGAERARGRNMHRTWRVPLPEARERDLALDVLIDAPVPAARAERERLGALPTAFSPLPPYLRKKACDFGWDWGPALTGSGLWRDVLVECWSTARLAAVRPTAVVEGDRGRVDLDVEVDRTATGVDATLDLRVRIGEVDERVVVAPGETRVRLSVTLVRPALWWPAGLGDAALHDLVVTLAADGTALDEVTHRIGFRSVVVEQTPEHDGGVSFGLTVNGVPLFVRGFNWIPDDTSVARVTDERYRARIADAQALGANLLRVWGGGVFEDHRFYRACDEAGMLVWQDFLFACAAYPEADPFPAEIEAEARENVTRLMPHPSLVLWNANNESLWFWFLHGWDELLDGAAWGERYYLRTLPDVLADLDPSRTYLIGSPSSGARDREPNDPTAGVVHCWLPGDYRGYDEVRPRFVSEFGFQGPPARATFDAVVHDAEPGPFSPGAVQRQKAVGGTERINDVLDAHFGVPTDFDEWYWLAQLNQARAVRYGVERFRTLAPYCRGTVVWQLNDCWPALSWSVVDSSGAWKPAAYAVRAAYADRILVLRHEEDGPALFACNAGPRAWRTGAHVARWSAERCLGEAEVAVDVPAGTALRVPLPAGLLAGAADGGLAPDELLVATADGSRSVLLGATDREFPDEPPVYGVDVSPAPDGVVVRAETSTLVRDLTLLTDGIDPDARADVNVLTLLPGERATWHVRTAHPDRFTAEAVRAAFRHAHAATVPDPHYRGLAALETA